MLSIPLFGYLTFKLKNKEYKIKYEDNMINEWLEKVITGLKNKQTIIIEEQTDTLPITITVSFFSTHILIGDKIVTDDGKINYEFIHINMLEFCNELYKDINNNKIDWIKSLENNEIKKKLEENLDNLKGIIDECQGDFMNYLSKCGCIQ